MVQHLFFMNNSNDKNNNNNKFIIHKSTDKPNYEHGDEIYITRKNNLQDFNSYGGNLRKMNSNK